MSQLKVYLKEAKTAIVKENYEAAVDFAKSALEIDPDNYLAYVDISIDFA